MFQLQIDSLQRDEFFQITVQFSPQHNRLALSEILLWRTRKAESSGVVAESFEEHK
jgi:hypothetical protein